MLNRYFKVDGNNSLDFMYANMAVKNIYFALISLDYIFDPDKYNVGVYHDEHAYYFFHIQSLLTACGNISNVFYNPNGYNGRRSTERCRRLRDMLGIKKTDYPLIFQTIFYKGIMPSEKVLDLPVDCNTLTGSVNL